MSKGTDEIKSVALWQRIRSIKERRGREADDVRLVSQLGWLSWSNKITEQQYMAGELWRMMATKCLRQKYDRRPHARVSQLARQVRAHDNEPDTYDGSTFEDARRAVGQYAKDLDELCVYDLWPTREELMGRTVKGLDLLAQHLRLDVHANGHSFCLHCGNPITQRRRAKKFCSDKCRVYASRAKA